MASTQNPYISTALIQDFSEEQKGIARSNIGAASSSDLSTLAESIAAPATANPVMDGTAAVGASAKYAREDHVHPSDTSREAVTNKTTVVLGASDSQYPTDKAVADFVNSSIATNTAHYISDDGDPFTSVAQLEAYTGTVTNNDYAFVTGTDSDGNTYYDRYKATVDGSTVTWALEYRLNNSSFTAAQWAAISSGITSALVAKIHEHSNMSVLNGITATNVSNWNGKMDKQTVGSTSTPIYLDNGVAKEVTNLNVASADIASATSSGAIQAGDDLNSYNTANRNYLCSAANASTVTNKPAGASDAFELEVIRGTGNTCIQIYYSRDDVGFNYIRKCTGINDTWTDWKLITVGSTAGNVEHPCYFNDGAPHQCYGVSTYSLFSGSLNSSSWTSISGTVSPSGNNQYILTDTSVIDLRKTGGTEGNTGSMHIRVKGDGNGCRTLTVTYLDVFGNTRNFELYWGNSSHFTRVNEFVVFWADCLFSLNQSVNRHCTIVPVRLPELDEWDGESV